mmetsp:Transcript_1550/g.3844  ORF Transcript_1550/g.3844 Transcript_1550/m.3844 type:complete len:132 (-) Transcript_1550:297-692(-)
MFGIIKETGVDDEGLKAFHDDYFPYPLYRDVNSVFYKAMGNRSLFSCISYNPFKLWRDLKAMSQRTTDKNIEGNMVGAGLITGGLILYSSSGEPLHVYNEETGTPFDLDELRTILESAKSSSLSSPPVEEL